MAFATLIITLVSLTERSQMPKLLLEPLPIINTSQHLKLRIAQQTQTAAGEGTGERHRPWLGIILFWFQTQKRRKEKVNPVWLLVSWCREQTRLLYLLVFYKRDLLCHKYKTFYFLFGVFSSMHRFLSSFNSSLSFWTEEEAKPKFKWVNMQMCKLSPDSSLFNVFTLNLLTTITNDTGLNLIIFNFRTFITPNLIPPKIPDGEKVDFDVREKKEEKKNAFDLFPTRSPVLICI